MGFAIPKIEYANVTKTATTANLSPTLTSIASTVQISAGMNVRGAGIQADTKVISTGPTTVLMDKNATAGATVSIEFYFPIEFDYQPIEKNGAQLDAKERVATSISGTRQTSIDFIEENRALVFSFITESIYLLMKDFFQDWALFGKTFRYYEDKTLTPFTDYELAEYKFTPEKVAPKSVSTFVWNVPLKMRRNL